MARANKESKNRVPMTVSKDTWYKVNLLALKLDTTAQVITRKLLEYCLDNMKFVEDED